MNVAILPCMYTTVGNLSFSFTSVLYNFKMPESDEDSVLGFSPYVEDDCSFKHLL